LLFLSCFIFTAPLAAGTTVDVGKTIFLAHELRENSAKKTKMIDNILRGGVVAFKTFHFKFDL
jgi:hypothetical protein